MASTLTWVDHDRRARERSERLLALFDERDTRDELGLGGVRDAIADKLFPGTSTIQTRLRYMIFTPWLYQQLEDRKVPSATFSRKAREAELNLSEALLRSKDNSGAFGRVAGKALKRLPSSVYWAGLGSWGIRRFDASRDEYHRAVDRVYARRSAERPSDGFEPQPDLSGVTWHPRLPPIPAGFPDTATFDLTLEEAAFLRDRLAEMHPDSLLTHLALKSQPPEAEFPWLLTDTSGLRAEHLEQLRHARLFSSAMNGAALLYNLLLAESSGRRELEADYLGRLQAWAASVDLVSLRTWRLSWLWEMAASAGRSIDVRTCRFVENWVGIVVDDPVSASLRQDARDLVRGREASLKHGRSRFSNQRSLDQWSGAAGIQPMSYRWSTAKAFLSDLHRGLWRS